MTPKCKPEEIGRNQMTFEQCGEGAIKKELWHDLFEAFEFTQTADCFSGADMILATSFPTKPSLLRFS